MDEIILDRIRGCVVGAAIGDALGMPLEFRPPSSPDQLEREMLKGRLLAGSFTDDTEMALALAESYLAHCPLDGNDLAHRFVDWYHAPPSDVGGHTSSVLSRIARGVNWEETMRWVLAHMPDSAGNGSLMRSWPVAVVRWNQRETLIAESELQSKVTHPHEDCMASCVFVNVMIAEMISGATPQQSFEHTIQSVKLPPALLQVALEAPHKQRTGLPNSGWVRHTLEAALWGLLKTSSFEDAVVNVVNLGYDADTTGAVAGALAGAAYGLNAIPPRWRAVLRGEWPLRSGKILHVTDLIDFANRLVEINQT